MGDQKTTVADIKNSVEAFIHARNWAQFHDAKNLSMALAVEAAELMEHFQWAKTEEVADRFTARRDAIEEEIADVGILLLALCNRYQVDLSTAIEKKLKKNAANYPIEKSYGKSGKYTEL